MNKTPARVAFSRNLRRNQTNAEKLLCSRLRNRQLEWSKLRRQHRIGPFTVDFMELEGKLIIELDGGQHNDAVDNEQSKWLESEGFRVLRFWNDDVFTNLEGGLEQIRTASQSPSS